MKQISLLLLLMAISIYTTGQVFKQDKNGQEFYQFGSKCLEDGRYHQADSLLSLALCTFKNENVYYNRAISRLFLNDTAGFCLDMDIAANRYLDNDAAKYFSEFCCRSVDTLYFDKKMNQTTKDQSKYYEIFQVFKYSDKQVGTIHNKNADNAMFTIDAGCNDDLLGVNLRPTDIIAIYEKVNGDKIYRFTDSHMSFSYTVKANYDNFKMQLAKFFDLKYQELKERNNTDRLTVNYCFTLSKNGQITAVEFISTHPEIELGDLKTEFINDLDHNVRYCPISKPAKFLGEEVNSYLYDSFTF